MKTIGTNAFGACTSLELTIPDQVATIGDNAFLNVKCISYTNNLKADKTNAPWGAKDYKIIKN
ncbi:leucine-rich repeat protein [bacterium]|nr:leucine-rich repeat protein [bacterium]